MRILVATLALLLASLLPAASHAELFEATASVKLDVEFPTLGASGTVWTSSGVTLVGVATPTGSRALQTLTIGPVSFPGSFVAPGVDAIVVGLSAPFLSLASGFFSGSPSGPGFAGSMPLVGSLRLCLFGQDCAGSTLRATAPPLSSAVGGPSSTTASAAGTFGAITLRGGPWTTGTAFNQYRTVTPSGAISTRTATRVGRRAGPASNASTVAVTGGKVQLVTPFRLSTGPSGLLGRRDIPAFAVVEVEFLDGLETTTTSTTTISTTTTTSSTTTTTSTSTTLPGARIALCHQSEDEGTQVTLRAAPTAVAAHLAHGDSLGACAP